MKNTRHIQINRFSLFIVFLCLANLVFGEDIVELAELEVVADKGDLIAQLKLGEMYYYGQGVEQDYEKAMKWLRQAAKQGNPRAQYYLGENHLKGLVYGKNFRRAVKWYRKAVNQGEADAQFALGTLYETGIVEEKDSLATNQGIPVRVPREFLDPEYSYEAEKRINTGYNYVKTPLADPYGDQGTIKTNYRKGFHVDQDYAEAVKLYQKAALQGHTQAQINLGVLCAKGLGTEKNLTMAYMWFTVANSDPEKANYITTQLINNLKAGMTTEQINEGDGKAEYWLANYKKE